MHIEVKLFAVAKQLVGQDSCQVDLAEGSTVADLRRVLAESVPQLSPLLATVMFAVEADYATESTVLSPGAEVAIIPPVSGG